MGGILTFVEQRDGVLRRASLEALSEAKRLAEDVSWPVTAVLVGDGVAALAPNLGGHGASKVVVADDPRLAAYSPEGYAAAVRAAVEKVRPTVLFLAASALGRDLSGRVAARLDAGCLSDVTRVWLEDGRVVAERPVYSGKALATVDGGEGSLTVVTLRPNVFPPQQWPGEAVVETLVLGDPAVRAVTRQVVAAEGAELDVAEADIVVSGGRGLKESAHFSLVRDLAQALGGAVGASRAVVDAGWIDHAHQVGQTGKVVSPALYVACGISGAIQHMAGMSSSKIIVAINKDPEAPIFKVADYGVVGDLFQVLPALVEEIRSMKSQG